MDFCLFRVLFVFTLVFYFLVLLVLVLDLGRR